MKPSLVLKTLELAIRAGQPTFLWGPPGVGKSQLVRQAADRLGLPVIDIRAVLLDPVDLRGLPHINGDNRAHWCTPAFLPTEGAGVLFLDELNTAPPLVQAACYQLVLDRKLGEYELPPGWAVVAAGNREGDKAVTHRMPSPLANRFIHIDVDVDLDDWTTWALAAGVQTEIVAFLRFRPALLHGFDPKRADRAFPTPRSWEFVSRLTGHSPDPAIEYEVYKGTVGEGAAAEFLSFLRIYRDLPNLDHLLADPTKAIVPTEPAALYAICAGLARKASEQNIGRVLAYGVRLPREFEVLLALDCVKRTPDIAKTGVMIQWFAKNSDILV